MKATRCGAVLVFTLLLGGCASGWIEDEDVGSATHDAMRAQWIHATPTPSSQGLDGVAAQATVDNYQKSAKSPHTDIGTQGGGSSSSVTTLSIGGGGSIQP